MKTEILIAQRVLITDASAPWYAGITDASLANATTLRWVAAGRATVFPDENKLFDLRGALAFRLIPLGGMAASNSANNLANLYSSFWPICVETDAGARLYVAGRGPVLVPPGTRWGKLRPGVDIFGNVTLFCDFAVEIVFAEPGVALLASAPQERIRDTIQLTDQRALDLISAGSPVDYPLVLPPHAVAMRRVYRSLPAAPTVTTVRSFVYEKNVGTWPMQDAQYLKGTVEGTDGAIPVQGGRGDVPFALVERTDQAGVTGRYWLTLEV